METLAPGVVTVAQIEEVLPCCPVLPRPALQRGALPTAESGFYWAAHLTLLPLASGPWVLEVNGGPGLEG